MNWLWIFAGAAVGALIGNFALKWAERSESNFYGDQTRVAAARTRISHHQWRAPLARLGAGAQIISMTAMLAFVASLFVILVAGHDVVKAGGPLGIIALILAGLAVFSSLVALPAAVLCRCASCARYLFDNRSTLRRGFTGSYKENWRVLRDRGRCPHCDTPFP